MSQIWAEQTWNYEIVEHKIMITITNLEGKPDSTPAVFADPRGTLAAVHVEIAPGVFAHVLLTGDGLMIRRGDVKIALPLAGLITLAARHGLIADDVPPPPPAPTGAHDDHFANK